MEEHLKSLEGVVERLETITGVSPPKVAMVKMVQIMVGMQTWRKQKYALAQKASCRSRRISMELIYDRS